jgi:hypothetical protein
MGRPLEAGSKAEVFVNTRMPKKMVEFIDSQRGSLTRGRYLRHLLRQEAARVHNTDRGVR